MITFLEYLSDVSDEQFEVDLIGEVDSAGVPVHELTLVHVKSEVKNIARDHVDSIRVRSYSAQSLFEQMESISKVIRSGITLGDSTLKASLEPTRAYNAGSVRAVATDNEDSGMEELLDVVLQAGGSYTFSIPPRRRKAVIPNASLVVEVADGTQFTHIGPRNADWRLIARSLVKEAGFLFVRDR